MRLRGMQFKANPSNSLRDPIYKITRGKWARGVVQAVEYLCEDMNSSPNPTKKK
jgi:hypothetical protein